MASFTPPGQTPAVATETNWPTKPQIVNTRPFPENVCQPFVQSLFWSLEKHIVPRSDSFAEIQRDTDLSSEAMSSPVMISGSLSSLPELQLTNAIQGTSEIEEAFPWASDARSEQSDVIFQQLSWQWPTISLHNKHTSRLQMPTTFQETHPPEQSKIIQLCTLWK